MYLRNDAKQLKIAAAQNTRERDFWLNQLAGELVKNNFPYDHKENTRGTAEPNIDSVTFTFPGEVLAQLMAISKGDLYTLNLVLITGIILLMHKYTRSSDIIIGTPIYKQAGEGEFINTVLALRNPVEKEKTFKKFLLQVRQTINDAVDNQNYPIELLAEQLNSITADSRSGFPLFDAAVLLENIHEKKYLRHIHCNVIFSFRKEDQHLEGIVEYNSLLYEKTTVENIILHLINLLQAAFSDPNAQLQHIEMLTKKEKSQLLYDFNNTRIEYPDKKTILQCLAEQVEKRPDHIAVSAPIDLNDIYDQLESETINPALGRKMEIFCFKKNSYVHQSPLPLPTKNENTPLKILKTRYHNSVIVNHHVVQLLDIFDGRRNLRVLHDWMKDLINAGEIPGEFFIYSMPGSDLLEISFKFDHTPEVFSIDGVTKHFEDFIQLVKALYRHHLLELVGVATKDFLVEIPIDNYFTGETAPGLPGTNLLETLLIKDKEISTAQVLLLGDTPGTATTGLLYLGSYLERNGINAYCQFYDPARDYITMKENIEELLQKIQPAVVAVSLKWFLYIARVLDMCRIIKEYARKNSTEIKVVIGGNTASYYWEEIIKNDCIDYLIRGDGEEPLLKICRGENETAVPNCICKKNGEILESPFIYVQDETNSSEIYLSHLEEILLSHHASRLGTFFIVTHKGCTMNCLYCGGCNQAQQKTFNRKQVFKRGVGEVRKDILAALPYTSTFQFEFDIMDKNLLEYCRQIWKGIDLSNHFCIFSALTPPSAGLVELVSQTFKYIYWDFDICTPSERHRKQLFSLGLVKSQPSDEDILEFMDLCEKYPNIEVRLNSITGLPYFSPGDIEPGEKLLSKIMQEYSCFGELHWARLHAQPGAPITVDAGKYDMHSYASTFEDFLTHSKENFNRTSVYSSVEDFNYPYIYYNDDRLNSRVTNFYLETNKKVAQHTRDKKRGLIASDTLTYRQLDEKAGQLAGILKTKGIKSAGIVGLMLERSIEIPVGIFGILKAGCAYMPIDPGFPAGRIQYMLNDSDAAALVTTRELYETAGKTIGWDGEKILLEPGNSPGRGEVSSPANLAYVIYTSGTTGKPKGVLLTQENLVNYVHWFTTAADLTQQDKTALTSSFAFDLGYTSLYTSLLNGGELHILPREIYLLAERLVDYIRQKGITYIKMTPSLFSVLVNSPNFSAKTCKSLRVAAIGGEAINVTDIEKAHHLCTHLKIMNHYGPTEATIGCVAAFIDFDKFGVYKEHPVIGKPIYNTNVYILGMDLNLLPVGVPGELCVSGAGVGRGYLNQPELTAEKFCLRQARGAGTLLGGALFEKTPLHPPRKSFCLTRNTNTNTIYRTGDLARWLPDGTIEFLGRVDKQVKIKGYRIELAEIEDRLRKHHQVKDALVVVKEPSAENAKSEKENRDKYLCAYIVPKKRKMIYSGNDEANTEIENVYQSQPLVTRFRELVKKNPAKIAVKSGDNALSYEILNGYASRLARRISEEYDDGCKLSKSERTRYQRQILLHGWGIAAQEKLKGTTVFVAGAGGGASPTIMQLALAGFGTIIICDFDVVELSNLNRQFLHDETRIGMNKAISAQMTLKKVNPNVNVIPRTEKLTGENVEELVGDAAFIFDMFDGLEAKFILSRYAVSRGIPHLISAMTDINAYSVVCHTPHTPCYHCIFDRKKWEEIAAGMERYKDRYQKNPLPVVATSLFMSTAFAVNEAIKIVLGLGTPVYNRFFFFNQRGSEDLAQTPGFRAMTHVFSEHFRNNCKRQGFDWEMAWRGNFLEELTIEPDPDCPLCGKSRETREKPAEHMKRTEKAVISIRRNDTPGKKEKENQHRQTVASLLSHDMNMAVGIIGTLKAGKILIPLDPDSDAARWEYILEDSEARIILADRYHLEAAEKLRNNVNKNIKIIRIDDSHEFENVDNPLEIGIKPGQKACILYPQDFNPLIIELYEALVKGTEPYIFAYNEGHTNSGSLSADLRQYLLDRLPDYMIPSHFVKLDKIPLTPNGKVDINILPAPGPGEGEEMIAPRDEVEEKLAVIWAEVLGKEKENIGIESNFFELGGHSLNATMMAARIHRELNIKLQLAEVFKAPTIKGLSGIIKETIKDKPVALELEAIEPVEKKEFYELSHAQKRVWISDRMEEKQVAYNISLAYEFSELNREAFENAIETLIKRHESLRTTFITVNGEPKQKIHHYESLGCSVNDLDLRKETNVEDIVQSLREKERRATFNLESGPLLRTGLLHIEENRYIFLFTLHHIISDGWSMGVIVKEFLALYHSYGKGKDNPLARLRIQYKDYSHWQNNQLSGEKLKKHQHYWLSQFSGEIPKLELPTDYPRPKLKSYEGEFIFFPLSQTVTRQVKRIGKESGCTLFITLLAVMEVFFYRYTGQKDIIIGTPMLGRENKDLENQIGFFVNMLALRNRLKRGDTFMDVIQRVKHNTLEAFEHQVYPFDRLAQELGGVRDLSRNPLFDVVVTAIAEDNEPGNTNSSNLKEEYKSDDFLEFGLRESKYDLRLRFIDQGSQIMVHVQYNPNLFKKERIIAVKERFVNLIADIVSNVENDIDNLNFRAESEKKQANKKFQGGF